MATSSRAQISIVVATCNRLQMLKTCIQSLLAQETEIPYEIIVLDQSDLEKQKASFFDSAVKLIPCDFKNKSRALNLGVKLASSDYIAVIDDDCIADKNWINRISETLYREGSTSIVTGRVIAGRKEKGAVLSRLHDDSTRQITFKKRRITPIFKLSGCNFGFHKRLYEIVGPFNENLGPGSPFKSSDDNEWSYRALGFGFPIVYAPEAIVVHRSWRNIEKDTQLMKDYGYAAGAFFKIIFQNSKSDFLYHCVWLGWWLLKTIFFSFNIHEVKTHAYYGLSFCKGFLEYNHQSKQSENFIDCLFVLSPGKYIGGAERYVQSLAEELQKQNGQKFIIAISHNHEFYLECKKNFLSIYLGDTLRDASIMLADFLKSKEITTVISNGYHSSYLVCLAKLKNIFQRKKHNFIDVKHGWITTNFSERFKTFFDKLVSIFYNFIVIVDQQMKRKLWLVRDEKVVFIPSAVTIRSVDSYKRPHIDNYLKILLVGRLAEEKRFELVLEALSHTSSDLWELTVVGDGPRLDLLKKTADQNNIREKVNFAGYQEDVVPFYRDSDLLIISSVNEGCPLIALEAMANNVLVLSTRVGYMPLLLAENRGFLVDISITAAELADKVKEIATLDIKTKSQMINKARDFVTQNHNLSKSVGLFANLIYRPMET